MISGGAFAQNTVGITGQQDSTNLPTLVWTTPAPPPPPVASCADTQETQTLSCPSPQTGSFTQTRTKTLCSTNPTPSYTSWVDSASSCIDPTPIPNPTPTNQNCTFKLITDAVSCSTIPSMVTAGKTNGYAYTSAIDYTACGGSVIPDPIIDTDACTAPASSHGWTCGGTPIVCPTSSIAYQTNKASTNCVTVGIGHFAPSGAPGPLYYGINYFNLADFATNITNVGNGGCNGTYYNYDFTNTPYATYIVEGVCGDSSGDGQAAVNYVTEKAYCDSP